MKHRHTSKIRDTSSLFKEVYEFINLKKTKKQLGEIESQYSKVFAICQSCNEEKIVTIKGLKRQLKSRGTVFCSKCSSIDVFKHTDRTALSLKTKKLWENPEYRRKNIESQKKLWTEEKRKEKSEESIKLWENPEYREKNSNSNKLSANTIEGKKIRHEIMKQVWKNSEYREHQIEIIINRSKDEKYKEKQSLIQKEAWTEEKKQEASERSKKLWSNSAFRNQFSLRMSEVLKEESKRKSSIETVTTQILSMLGIEFEEQKPVGPWLFDFYLPQYNLYIECQGEYWHSSDKMKKKDASKFTYLKKVSPTSNLLYLHERDFLNPKLIEQKITKQIFGINDNQIIFEFNFKDLEIKELSIKDKLNNSRFSASEVFLQSFHYAGFGRSAKVIFGAYLGDELIAVCKFGRIIRKEVATSMDINFSEVLELDRFCIHPQYQKKNFASWFISRCSKLVKKKLPKIKCLVSFADSTQNHDGTIYKAANWIYVKVVKPDYHYINEDGWIIHKKTLYNHACKMSMKEREYAEKFKYTKVYGKEKHKYCFYF